MASIRRHPNDRSWQVRYRDPAGTQRTKAFTRQVDAKAFAADVESDKRDLPELVLPDDQAAVAPPSAPHIEITDTETGELLSGIFLGAMNRESMAQEIFGLPLAWVERREVISRETIPADYIEEREEASRQRAETMERLVEALEGEKGQQLLDGLLAAIDDYEPEGDS